MLTCVPFQHNLQHAAGSDRQQLNGNEKVRSSQFIQYKAFLIIDCCNSLIFAMETPDYELD